MKYNYFSKQIYDKAYRFTFSAHLFNVWLNG